MRRAVALLIAALVVAACRTSPLDIDSYRDGGVVVGDGGTLADLKGGCLPQNKDAATGDCPCGSAGLCRPATGRLSVEAQAGSGALRVVVMDDNGCNRHDVAADQPLGTPRWAPDHERLAYITVGTSRGTLHVLRISAAGGVVCHERLPLGSDLQATGVAWASDEAVWLFSPRNRTLTRFHLRNGVEITRSLDAIQFDALLAGPLVTVDESCGPLCSRVATRPLAESGPLTDVLHLMDRGGPVRLAPDGHRFVVEFAHGYMLARLDQPGAEAIFPEGGGRSPTFALGGQAIAYSTDDGQLRYKLIEGPQAGLELTIPPSWRSAFVPDWAPPPAQCQPVLTCL